MEKPDEVQQLLAAKDRIIEQQSETISLLEELAEQRRLVHLHQCLELADLRRYHHVNNRRWGFLMFMLLSDIWPFKHIWNKETR